MAYGNLHRRRHHHHFVHTVGEQLIEDDIRVELAQDHAGRAMLQGPQAPSGAAHVRHGHGNQADILGRPAVPVR